MIALLLRIPYFGFRLNYWRIFIAFFQSKLVLSFLILITLRFCVLTVFFICIAGCLNLILSKRLHKFCRQRVIKFKHISISYALISRNRKILFHNINVLNKSSILSTEGDQNNIRYIHQNKIPVAQKFLQ